MRKMVLVKASEDGDKDFVSNAWSTAVMEAVGRFNKQLLDARSFYPQTA